LIVVILRISFASVISEFNNVKKVLVFGLICSFCYLSFAQKGIDPKLTEVWEPKVPRVIPYKNAIPSDAIMLFDGKNFDNWTGVNGELLWTLNDDGSMTVKPKTGSIKTKKSFGSIQLHVEWKSPIDTIGRTGQQRGNSGVFLQELYKIQILDNNNNETYSNGQVGSVYKQSIPLAMASFPTGEWNTYDIIYCQPEFDKKGNVVKKAIITLLHNGILVLDHFEIQGTTVWRGQPSYQIHGKAPIMLQDHGCEVSYRNIWVREI